MFRFLADMQLHALADRPFDERNIRAVSQKYADDCIRVATTARPAEYTSGWKVLFVERQHTDRRTMIGLCDQVGHSVCVVVPDAPLSNRPQVITAQPIQELGPQVPITNCTLQSYYSPSSTYSYDPRAMQNVDWRDRAGALAQLQSQSSKMLLVINRLQSRS